MSAGLRDVHWAAERMGERSMKRARARLHELHRQHGGLLFRSDGGRNTKLWVDGARLFEIDPKLARRTMDVVTRLDELEQEMAGVRAFQAKAAAWFRSKVGRK